VIIAEELVDHDYVDKYTIGYEELKERVAQFPPEKVAPLQVSRPKTCASSRASSR
jgi:anaerobic selenocysteine-containing dehydrogenase